MRTFVRTGGCIRVTWAVLFLAALSLLPISCGGGSCIHAPHSGASVCKANGSWICALRF